MKTTYLARTDAEQEVLDNARGDIAWAEAILEQPPRTFPNGKSSHAVAIDAWHKAHDALVPFLAITGIRSSQGLRITHRMEQQADGEWKRVAVEAEVA